MTTVERAATRGRPKLLDDEQARLFIDELVGERLHAKRVLSLANGVLGVMHSVSLSVFAIGEARAAQRDLEPKHAIKQIDRLLSNRGFDLDVLAPSWVNFVCAERKQLVVALDWTDFDADKQSTLVLNLITEHGRATPLLWKTVDQTQLAA